MSVSSISALAHRAAAGYLCQLKTHELRTKALTVAVFNFLSEVIARHLAGVPAKHVGKHSPWWKRFLAKAKINPKAVKMALYGLLVAAPLNHYMVSAMHKFIPHHTHAAVQWRKIALSMVLITPVQIVAHLTNLAVVDGARSKGAIVKTIKTTFVPALALTWLTSPPSLAFAQVNFPREAEMPFFNLVQFFTGTLITSRALIAQEQEKKAGKNK